MASSRLAVQPSSRNQQQSKMAFLGRDDSWQDAQVSLEVNKLDRQDAQPQSATTDAASVAHSSFSFGSRAIDDFFPLKSMADRISAQVEDFAIAVDKWSVELDRLRDQEDSRHASQRTHQLTVALVAQLQNIVKVTTEDLRKKKLRGAQDLSKSWKRRIDEVIEPESGSLASKSQTRSEDQAEIAAYNQLQAELNTWSLFHTLVDLRHPDPTVDISGSKQAYSKRRGPVQPQTPGSELWERFLFDDDEAREKKKILQWLERCADSSDSNFDTIIEQLEASAGTGKGTWSHGWLNTRQKIKTAKMVKSVSGPVTVSALDIPNSDRTAQLVTQLDPDVRTRQGRSLEQPDELYERSLWLACFAMLRRGMTWQEIREWCEERNESWRAVSMGMAGKEQTSRFFVDEPSAGALWRRMCFAIARQSGVDRYERAVYGLLAGDVQSVEPVCRSWDDHLYIHYNAVLVYAFEKYLQAQCPDRLTNALVARFSSATPVTGYTAASQIIEKLGQQQSTQSESREPIKIIQGSLIAQTLPDFVHQLGIAISKKVNTTGHDDELIPPTDEKGIDTFDSIISDYNIIRTIVHVYIIYDSLTQNDLSEKARGLIENVIVFYMDFLRRIGKVESLPTYAKFISTGRREHVLGTIMTDVVNRDEQKQLVHLMNAEKINLPLVVRQQLWHSLQKANILPGTFDPIDKIDLLEGTADTRWPGLRIKYDFAVTALTELEIGPVRAAEWFLFVGSAWKATFAILTAAMKSLLLSGHWSAALAMTKTVAFHDLSLLKSQPYFDGRPIDVFSPEDEEIILAIDEEEAASAGAQEKEFRRTTRASTRAVSAQPEGPTPLSPEEAARKSRDRRFTLASLQEDSRRLLEMQQLCLILERLAVWRSLEDQAPVNTYGPIGVSEYKRMLRDELEELEAAMVPLLAGGFMATNGKAKDEDDYTVLLHAYIPSVLLAYNTAIVYASIYLGPETLLRSFTLANTLAAEPPTYLPPTTASPANPFSPTPPNNSNLVSALINTNAMQQMIEGFAAAAKILLKLNQEEERREKAARKAEADVGGPPHKKKKQKRRSSLKRREWAGETLDLWDPTRVGGVEE